MDLRGKVALVTGAAHRVGRGIALALAGAGAHIVLHYGRSQEEAARTEGDLRALGVGVLAYSADLRDPDAITALFEAARAHFGRLDVLVNSAASFDRQPFDTISVEDWERSLQINLRAPFLATQQAARLMRIHTRPEGESALIVNISDLSGIHVWRGYTQHGVSKAGLLHLTRITARELAPEVRVNAIVPGPILPPPGAEADSDSWARAQARVPLRRAGSPELVGEAVLFLARNDFITGAALPLDGGEALLARPVD